MSLKQSRKSISIPGKLYARALAHAQANGKPLAAIVTQLLEWHLSHSEAPAVVTRDTAPPMVARLMDAVGVDKPRANPRGKNPDGVTPRTINNHQARLALIKRASRERVQSGPGPRDGVDVPGAMPARVKVPVSKREVKW